MQSRRRHVPALLSALALVASALPAPAAAAVYEFPPGETGYHTYPEMAAEVAAAAQNYPAIVSRFSIGTSSMGRELWAVKISDNVGVDEAEPEVLFDGLHHGDEHMSLEMTLAILRWLTTGYGSDPRITKIVDNREIWIVFAMNPDGATYNIRDRVYRNWRKNRQPTPGSTAIGTDLNRNYDYRWGCCGGSSTDPASSRFRGPGAFSAPETRALRDFVNSRVVGGRQQITTGISFHTTGRVVMYPYGYTLTNVPGDMTVDDHAAFVALAQHMAATSGYRAQQASDMYIQSGGSTDWMYGRHRIFAFVIEMEPNTALYQHDEQIGPETTRNREAVLYLLEQASCPYTAASRWASHCGAFADDFEIGRGWVVNPNGNDTATSGAWSRANPEPTSYLGPKQLGTTTSGSIALVTGPKAGTSIRSYDLDGGRTSVRSPAITLPDATGQRLTFRYYLAHGADSEWADELRVAVVDAGGHATTVLLERGAANDDDAAWASFSVLLDAWRGTTIRILISATDAGRPSLVEAAVDDVRVTRR